MQRNWLIGSGEKMKTKLKTIVKPLYMMLPPKCRYLVKLTYRKCLGISIENEFLLNSQISGDVSLLSGFSKQNGTDILFFPVIDWYFRVQRPQQLAKELGNNGARVIYFSTTFKVNDNPGFDILDSPCDNVIICRLYINSHDVNIYKDKLSESQVGFLMHGIQSVRLAFNFGFTSSFVNLPFWRCLVESIPSNHIIYDCMDHHAGFENNDSTMLEEEMLLFHSSDLVVTTAQHLSEKVSEYTKNIIIRNGCEVDYFSSEPNDSILNKSRPIVGYYGAIAEWFDIDLLVKCASAYPDYDFIMIGNVTCDITQTKKIKNIKFLGEIPYRELTKYLKDFDVCLIPFKLIELTLCTNPVKVYEYLASGKPVVCTAMPEVQIIDDIVHVADSYDDFIRFINISMKESTDLALQSFRKEWAKNHDWNSRAHAFENELNNLNLLKLKVSIIVLTYNNLHLTIECLNSIARNTIYDNYEVIIVDNLSTDGTREYLTEHYSNRDRYKIILNDHNLGFAEGNNVGLKSATGDILVILNNDTYVGPYWLGGLIKALHYNSDLGMVGPVTNNIGNEAKISIKYDNWSEMSQKSLAYNSKHSNQLYPVDCLAFFCVAIRKEVYDQVGEMCIDYGLGFFEDDDYCMRVKKSGWKLAVVEDSFVHHHLSASFNKLKSEHRQKLMDTNKAIFEKKWGTWTPHKYRKGVI
jgi:GT2 family glycosyltransferase/glycosyltransferase involved in cell wall biosynthesis